MRKRITKRTPERLIRAAHGFEHLAANLRSKGLESYADAVNTIASMLGNCGRSLEDTLEQRK